MVGNKGKGSRSKQKAEPVESRLLETSPNINDSVVSDVNSGQNDTSFGREIPMADEQEQIVEVPSGFVGSDEIEENDQNALEDNDDGDEIDFDVTENVSTQEGTIDDGKEGNDVGHATPNLSVEDYEDSIINTDNPKEEEAPLKFDNNDVNTGNVKELTTENVSVNNEGLDSDHGLIENMTNDLENHKEPSELNAEEVADPNSGNKEEENANITNEVKVVTGEVSQPKKKVVKKKLVKKLVRKNPVNKEASQPSDENNVIGEVSGVDADKQIDIENKASDLNNASVGEGKVDNNKHASNEEDADKDVNIENKASDLINASAGEGKVDNNERGSVEEEAEAKPSVTINKKRNRFRKKKAKKPQSENDKLGSKEKIAINEPDLKNEEAENSGDKTSLLKNKKKNIAEKGSGSGSQDPKDVKKPQKGKSSKRVESMGMIFMCSKETKQDCYKYKVLGLPASKKDMVLKIYKGMRLFLFDVDLRLMYGIYKASGPGGYNIEPSAFKSQFPSQVRFTVLKDCVPLAEERFRKVLKDNYYSKNKFKFELNNEQVNNLCKLFQQTNKKAESTKAAINKTQNAPPTSSSTRRDKKRKRVEDRPRGGASSSSARQNVKKSKRFEDTRRVVVPRPRAPPLDQVILRRAHEEIRVAPIVITNRYHDRPAYARETYLPIYQPILAPRSPPSRTYAYDRVIDPRVSTLDPYRRETIIDPRDLAPSSRVSRVQPEQAHYDTYVSYREAPLGYSGTRREQYDYGQGTSDRQYAEYYRSADYRASLPSLPLYRRY